MAVVIESTNTELIQTVGSPNTAEVFPSTGITTGDLLVIVFFSDFSPTTPSGWSEESTVESIGIDQHVWYKTATSSDETATQYDISGASSSTDRYSYAFYRISGQTTGGSPFLYNQNDTVDGGTTSPVSDTISVTCTNNSLLLYLGAVDQNTDSSTFSGYSLTGPTVSLTERLEDRFTTDQAFFVVDGITSAGSGVTNYSFDLDTDYSSNRTHYINILVIPGQQAANGTLTLETNTNTEFSPSGNAGANASPAIEVNTNTAFNPNGLGAAPTVWTSTQKS